MKANEVNLIDFLSDAVEDKIIGLAAFRGYVTEKDICEIINAQTGMSLEGDEKKVITAEALGLEWKTL